MARLLLATALWGLVSAGAVHAQSDDPVQVADEVPQDAVMARVDCLIAKESGGLDVPNRQGSPARGPGQYYPSTWQAHTALYRAATGYDGPLDLHSLSDVRTVMRFVLGTYPWMRSAWAVGGCA